MCFCLLFVVVREIDANNERESSIRIREARRPRQEVNGLPSLPGCNKNPIQKWARVKTRVFAHFSKCATRRLRNWARTIVSCASKAMGSNSCRAARRFDYAGVASPGSCDLYDFCFDRVERGLIEPNSRTQDVSSIPATCRREDSVMTSGLLAWDHQFERGDGDEVWEWMICCASPLHRARQCGGGGAGCVFSLSLYNLCPPQV